jgi:hypothetical protein
VTEPQPPRAAGPFAEGIEVQALQGLGPEDKKAE